MLLEQSPAARQLRWLSHLVQHQMGSGSSIISIHAIVLVLSALDLGESLVKRWNVRNRLAHSTPLFDALWINEHCGTQSNILISSASGMKEPILSDCVGAGIRQDGEFS